MAQANGEATTAGSTEFAPVVDNASNSLRYSLDSEFAVFPKGVFWMISVGDFWQLLPWKALASFPLIEMHSCHGEVACFPSDNWPAKTVA